jgi:hypothetical protein
VIFTVEGAETPREGSGDHWELYRRAVQERPDLVREIEEAITVAVNEQLAHDKVVNSSWLGSRVLDRFPRRKDWDEYVSSERASSGLFGMILWTVLSDDPREWVSTLTTNTNANVSQRVFWRR